MTIVCLGWGSLTWCQKALPVRGAWQANGPALPIEFARESNDKRITLVITKGATPVRTLWAALDVNTLEDAQAALAAREGISVENITRSIGTWSAGEEGAASPGIDEWAAQEGFAHVVWTALKPKIGKQFRTPDIAEVLGHLTQLEGADRDRAEGYVRLTPRQIITPYRAAIEAGLGWTPRGLI